MKRKRRTKNLLIILIIAITFISAGCKNTESTSDEMIKDDASILQIDPEAGSENMTITLYFKHAYSSYLVPQQREVAKGNQSMEKLVLEELLKGPQADEALDKVAIMPPNVQLLDVDVNGDTVFVNLTEAFLSNIEDPTTIQTVDSKRQKQLKGLAIYSIVNTLTEIPGIMQVKILVENKTISYKEATAQLLLEDLENVTEDTSMLSIKRGSKYILTPAVAAELLLKNLAAGPVWEASYPFLYVETQMGNTLPSQAELEKLWSANVKEIEIGEDVVTEEEIRSDGTAFVTANYAVDLLNGAVIEKKDVNISAIASNGIWKIKFPDDLLTISSK